MLIVAGGILIAVAALALIRNLHWVFIILIGLALIGAISGHQ
jgi:hypothetical protein